MEAYTDKSFGKFETVNYEALRRAARHYAGENGYCAVIAIAIATGCKFGKARAMLARKGRGNGEGTPRYMTHTVMRELGYEIKTVDIEPTRLNNVHTKLPKEGTFFVGSDRHITCIRDGVNHDWSADKSVRGSGRMVRTVHRVVRSH